MQIKKISFCGEGNFNEGSFRIPFVWMKYYLSKKYICLENKIDKSIDLYFCKAGQGYAKKIREKMPDKKIILFKPHLEISTNINIFKPIRTTKSLIALFLEIVFKNQFKNYQNDINSSDILIADSRKLKLQFEASTNKKVIYLRLVERIANDNIRIKKGLCEKNKVVFLFHGSIMHYNESYEELHSLLSFISIKKKVDFICISNLDDIKKKIRINNVKSTYIPYSYEILIHYLDKADIGYVPNFLRPKLKIVKKLHDYFNFLFFQLNLYSITEKNSSNAGRAYLYAQYGIPIICHPTREIITEFSQIENLDFPNNKQESLFILKKYLEDDFYYRSISKSLFEKSKEFNIELEIDKLLKFINKSN